MPESRNVFALYALLIGVVMFISVFLLFVNLLPPELYNPYKTYRATNDVNDISVTQFNAFTFTQNFTLSSGTGFTKVFFNTTEVWIQYYRSPTLPDPNGTVFGFRHFEWSWWIIPTHHDFTSAEAVPFDFSLGGSVTGFTNSWVMRFYDNATDSATFSIRCPHVTLKLTFTSNSSSYTLASAMKNLAPLHVFVSWSYDFSAMGANVWSLLGTILTFQTIKTGIATLDGVLNSIISLPIWVAIAYLAYRFLTGLIPFLSGGGGE